MCPSATAQFDTASGNLKATIAPQVTTPPPPGVSFVHYDPTTTVLDVANPPKLAQFQASATSPTP